MSDSQSQRRRPAVTYGRPMKKRFMDVENIFSSNSALTKPRNSKTEVRKAGTTPVPGPIPASSAKTKEEQPGASQTSDDSNSSSDRTFAPLGASEEGKGRADNESIFDFPNSDDDEDDQFIPRRAPVRITKNRPKEGLGASPTRDEPPKQSSLKSKKRPLGTTVVAKKWRRVELDTGGEAAGPSTRGRNQVLSAVSGENHSSKGDKTASKTKVTGDSVTSEVRRAPRAPKAPKVPKDSKRFPRASKAPEAPELSRPPQPAKPPEFSISSGSSAAIEAPIHGSGTGGLTTTFSVDIYKSDDQLLAQEFPQKGPLKKAPASTLAAATARRLRGGISGLKPTSSKGSTPPVLLLGSPPPDASPASLPLASKDRGQKTQAETQPRGTKRLSEEVSFSDEVELTNAEEERPVRRRRLIDALGASNPQIKEKTPSISESISEDESYQQSSQLQLPDSQPESAFDSQLQFRSEPVAKSTYTNGRMGPKVTYSRQRSFRADENADENDIFKIPLLMEPSSFGMSRFSGKSNMIDEGLEEEVTSKKGMMKSIHELREAGSNHRFLDDVEELFSDIENKTSLGRNRSGYLELARKMQDKEFVTRFRGNNFDGRLLPLAKKQTDEIICFALSYIIGCLLHDDSTIQTVSEVRNNGTFGMLVCMLDCERDIQAVAKDKKTNLSKATQGVVNDLRIQIEKSLVFYHKPKLFSPRVMGMMVLEMTVRKLREANFQGVVLSPATLKKLIQMLEPFVSGSTPKVNDLLVLELLISTLESFSIGYRIDVESPFSDAQITTIAKVIPAIIRQPVSGGNGGYDTKDILLLALRLNINITNDQTPTCDLLAGSDLIPVLVEIIRKKFEELSGSLEELERLINLDFLVLSLGLMNNFAEMSSQARCAVLGTTETGGLLLDVLSDLFLERLARVEEADSLEESQSNVGFGYLSILLGNLCQDTEIRLKFRNKMPNSTLDPLFSSMEEFIAHHRKVDEEREGAEYFLDGAHNAYTERLEKVVRRLKEGY